MSSHCGDRGLAVSCHCGDRGLAVSSHCGDSGLAVSSHCGDSGLAVSNHFDSYKCFFNLAKLFKQIPPQLLWKVFCHAAINVKLFI